MLQSRFYFTEITFCTLRQLLLEKIAGDAPAKPIIIFLLFGCKGIAEVDQNRCNDANEINAVPLSKRAEFLCPHSGGG